MVMFALPIMAVNLLQLVFNAADMIVVGRFEGARALAAVGATGSLFNLIVNLFMGLSVGTAVIVAQDYGARRVEDPAVGAYIHRRQPDRRRGGHRHRPQLLRSPFALDGDSRRHHRSFYFIYAYRFRRDARQHGL